MGATEGMVRDLVIRAQGGDRDAYELLARSAAPRLYAVASRVLRGADEANDVVQQALLSIWLDLPGLRDPDRFDAWAYRILIRHARHAAAGARARRHSVTDVSESLATRGDHAADVAAQDQLSRAFLHLTAEHRAVVVLHHVVGLPLGEIAEILEIPYGTVGSRLHHAMRAMREAIAAGERAPAREGQPA
jgi:RNA polymerase sigma-70 factor (ECF subfamily)